MAVNNREIVTSPKAGVPNSLQEPLIPLRVWKNNTFPFPVKVSDGLNQIFTGVYDLKITVKSAISLCKLEYFLVKRERQRELQNQKTF